MFSQMAKVSKRAKIPQLPMEIWLNIISYLPRSKLVYLKSLNTAFFYSAMDIDWGTIAIDARNSDKAALVFRRMADPFVAGRTTRLVLYLRESRTSGMLYLKPRLPTILFHVRVVQGPEPTTQAALMTLFLKALPLMHNLRFLKIKLLLIPLNLIQDLFRAITTCPFARTIEELSLTGHSDLFSSLVERSNPETPFPNLSKLDLLLIDRDNEDNPMATFNTNTMLSIARFILSLSSLQDLRIVPLFDVSPLFTRLSQPLHDDSSSLIPLPNLKSIILIPFNLTFRFSPQSVRRFLLVHSTNIQHLRFSLANSCWPLSWDLDKVLDEWFSDFVNASKQPSPFFPNLQSLDILPSDTRAGLSATLVFIKRTAPTLTSLRIRQCGLDHEGATEVVHALTASKKVEPGKLKSLQLDICRLEVPFIELLAIKLPQLQQLRLCSKNHETTRSSQERFVTMLRIRRYQVSLEDDCFTSWKLRYLSIKGLDSIDMEGALAPFIPSVVVLGDDDDESDDEE